MSVFRTMVPVPSHQSDREHENVFEISEKEMGSEHFFERRYCFVNPFGNLIKGWSDFLEKCTWTHTLKATFTTSGAFLQRVP